LFFFFFFFLLKKKKKNFPLFAPWGPRPGLYPWKLNLGPQKKMGLGWKKNWREYLVEMAGARRFPGDGGAFWPRPGRESAHSDQAAQQTAEQWPRLTPNCASGGSVRPLGSPGGPWAAFAGLAHELRKPHGNGQGHRPRYLARTCERGKRGERANGRLHHLGNDRANSLITRFLQFAGRSSCGRKRPTWRSVLDGAWPCGARGPASPFTRTTIRILRRFLSTPSSWSGSSTTWRSTRAGQPRGRRNHGEDARRRPGGRDLRDRRGSGIDPAQIGSIFNPFFTTKPHGVGWGWPSFENRGRARR